MATDILGKLFGGIRNKRRYGEWDYEMSPEEEEALTEYDKLVRSQQGSERDFRPTDIAHGLAGFIDPDRTGTETVEARQAKRDEEFKAAQKDKFAREDRAREQEREDFDFERAKTTAEREDVTYDRNEQLQSFLIDPESKGSQLVRKKLDEIFPEVGFEGLNAEQMRMMMEHPAVQLHLDEAMADKEFARELAKERAKLAAALAKEGAKPSKFQEEVEKGQAEQFQAAQEAASEAPAKISDIDEMLDLLGYDEETQEFTGKGINTGMITGSALAVPVRRLFDSEGQIDRFNQLSANLRLAAADQLSGVLSDSDMALLRDSVANLQSDESANVQSLLKAKELLQKAQVEAQSQKAYVNQHGSLEGYTPYWQADQGDAVDWADM